jgi:NADH dehydrogenase/NADH:ubiquinone oxidoreductase subunit G
MYINGATVETQYRYSSTYPVPEMCEPSKIDIPRFRYHNQLPIAGNCRLCLIEVGSSTKLILSRLTPAYAEAGVEVYTNTILPRQARECISEFPLINHPPDRPICDQGGECDPQEPAETYGPDRGRFYDARRTQPDKYFGPIVKGIMTRCIHRTRRIRFPDEIIRSSTYGTIGRGVNTEIGTYLYFGTYYETPIEVLGNVVDLCPVGQVSEFFKRAILFTLKVLLIAILLIFFLLFLVFCFIVYIIIVELPIFK